MALDSCEPEIIRAFERAGWFVDDKPHHIALNNRDLFADLRLRSGDNLREIVVIEVKCFNDPDDDLPEIYHATGQYLMYRLAMDTLGDQHIPLYLALPEAAYERFRFEPIFLMLFNQAGVKLVIVDLEREVIVQWDT